MNGLIRSLVALFLAGIAALAPVRAHGQGAGARLGAQASVIHPEIIRLSAALRASRGGPTAYATLRELFALWDLVDPAQVEEALRAASESASSPAVRVYSRVLLAQARTRRGDPEGAHALMAGLGFVDRWLFVGPFDDENRTGFASPFQPESELAQPIVPGRAFDGKERPVRWRASLEGGGAVLDLGDYLRPRDKACGYATVFATPQKGSRTPRKATLWLGAEGAVRVFWNQKNVFEDGAYRGFDFDRFAVPVELEAGVNRLTVKVCSDSRAPALAVRFADADGAPDPAIVLSNDPADSEAAARRAQETAKARPGGAASDASPSERARAAGNFPGPAQVFERLAQAAKPSAQDLEDYARYLVLTGGDPRGEHRARDLASRAADAQPNTRRLLLAAQLAEDRNSARELVELARGALDERDVAGRVAVLVASARIARMGIQWRDAAPFYEEARALDPDSVAAVLGRTELYVQAGLPRTALAILEAAVVRQPRAVALLRIQASQLRALGRDTEADEIDARVYALRADDPAFAARQVDHAVATRDVASAERWLSRLRQAEPDLVYALTAAARAHRSLGKSTRAKQALEAALEVAPEETATLRSLADLAGEEGDREGQLRHLRKILALYPQAKDIRTYVEFLSPPVPRQDEQHAWDRDRIAEAAKRAPGKEKKRVLRDLTVTTVFANGLASRFHQVVFQPLSDEAAAEARQFLVHYQGDKQEIELRTARVYRADGTVAEAIESGEGAANNPAIAMYTSTRAFAVSFPRLYPGDVVELRYRVDDVAVKNDVADQFNEIAQLQGGEPTLSSEYVVIAPKTRRLFTFVANIAGVKETVEEKGDQRVYTFTANDVPPLPIEPGMPPFGEIAGQVHVSTFQSWEELGRWYWGLARDQLDVDDQVRKKLKEITASAKDDASRVRAVYRYATLLRYVALELGIEGIKPRRCALTLARGWGDCKDKATVIVTMLRELGIPAKLVLVRTSQRGDLAKGAPPSMAAFDHAIAYVPSLDLYLDGTAEGAGSTELPAMNRGSVALVIDETTPALVRLPTPPAEASPHLRKVDLALAADGSAQLTFESSVQGVHAAGFRARYHGEGTRRERATRDVGTLFGPIEMGRDPASLVVREADDVEKPVTLTVRARAAVAARREGDALSVPASSSLDLASSLAALSARKTELVVGGLSSAREERTIRLPAGHKIRRVPTAGDVDGPFGRAVLEVKAGPGQVVVTTTMALKKSRITPAEYGAFREFCQKVDDLLGQRLLVGP